MKNTLLTSSSSPVCAFNSYGKCIVIVVNNFQNTCKLINNKV